MRLSIGLDKIAGEPDAFNHFANLHPSSGGNRPKLDTKNDTTHRIEKRESFAYRRTSSQRRQRGSPGKTSTTSPFLSRTQRLSGSPWLPGLSAAMGSIGASLLQGIRGAR